MNNFLRAIRRGMTYDGQIRDVAINYGLIAIALLPYVFAAQRREDVTDWSWAACLGIALLVQVLLWFTVRATGVSIIWSALAGYTFMELWSGGTGIAQQNGFLALVALGGAGAGIVYYGLIYPLITTIAHLCAVVLGVGIWLGLR